MSQIKEIFEGWFNDLFPTEEINHLSKERLEQCMNCPVRDHKKCSKVKKGEAIKDFLYKGEIRYKGKKYNGCGCFIKLKASSPKSHCPIGKF